MIAAPNISPCRSVFSMIKPINSELGAADMIFFNGKVLCLNNKLSFTEAVAVKNERIMAVGKTSEIKPLVSKYTRSINLQGRTVIPGINDSHIHASLWGSTLPPLALDLRKAKTAGEVLSLIEQAAKVVPTGHWIRGFGLDSFLLGSGFSQEALPSLKDLDRVASANPVYLGSMPFHSPTLALLNTRAIEILGLKNYLSSNLGGDICLDHESGEPTGMVIGNLVNKLVPPLSREEKQQAILLAMQKLNSYGITSITEPGLGPGGHGLFGGLWDNECLHAYTDLMNLHKLTVRVNVLLLFTPYGTYSPEMMLTGLNNTGIHTGFGNEWLRIGGLKLYADGIPPMRTAWMKKNYPGDGNGKLVFPGSNDAERKSRLSEIIMKAHVLGFQVGIHATGDQSIACCVEYFKQAEERYRKNLRHYIIHGDFVPKEYASVMAESKIGVSVQPALAKLFFPLLESSVGKLLARKHLPIRKLLESGVIIAGGSDAPVTEPDWRLGVASAVLRRSESAKGRFAKNLSLIEALKMYTLAGAWLEHMENLKGSLEPGKLADLCILDGDLLETEVGKVSQLPIWLTMVGGRIVYQSESAGSL